MKNKRMKIARIEVDMNQTDLAEAVGITRQTIGLLFIINYFNKRKQDKIQKQLDADEQED